jgi:hypothetical protein
MFLPVTAAALALWSGGCSSPSKELPKTYDVTGKVVFKNGQPLSGGTIQFQPTTDSGLTTTGRIQPDGGFSLNTLVGETKLPGAAAGKYRVTVIPPMGADQAAQPISIPEAYTVKPQDDNHFQITIDQPRRRP